MKNLVTGLFVVALAATGAHAAGQPGAQAGSASMMTGADARSVIKDWPQVSQQAAQSMLDRYGQPDVVSNILLVWKDKAPFTRISVTKEGVRHLFPMEHQDVLTEEISLAVPIDKLTELAQFNGSLIVDRTKGTVAARADKESSNFLALNLADDIINGKRDAQSARKFYADTLAKQMSGKSSVYTEKLNFSVSGDTASPDQIMSGSTGSSYQGGGASTSGGVSPSGERVINNPDGSVQPGNTAMPSDTGAPTGGAPHHGD